MPSGHGGFDAGIEFAVINHMPSQMIRLTIDLENCTAQSSSGRSIPTKIPIYIQCYTFSSLDEEFIQALAGITEFDKRHSESDGSLQILKYYQIFEIKQKLLLSGIDYYSDGFKAFIKQYEAYLSYEMDKPIEPIIEAFKHLVRETQKLIETQTMSNKEEELEIVLALQHASHITIKGEKFSDVIYRKDMRFYLREYLDLQTKLGNQAKLASSSRPAAAVES